MMGARFTPNRLIRKREPMQDVGKYITIYQRQPDGAWRMGRDIWNSDRPLSG